ncbi:MAG: hypothetical protein HY716_08170 [Planctomycetes bacterium]|nr:hypothetical protein [Planctomycetota bacterium]
MKVIEELKPAFDRQLRHTWVQGRDGKSYKILTLQLYDTPPPLEFPNWEVSVVEVNEHGAFRTLVQPLLKRFFEKNRALDFHDRLLDTFDEFLKLPEAKKEEHKKPAPAASAEPKP